MTKTHITLLAILLGASVSTTALAEPSTVAEPPVKFKTLRDRDVNAPVEMDSDNYRTERERGVLPRDFVQQPPLIPHSIKGYNITKNFNKCVDCHSWGRTAETGATKISITHFRDRDGKELTSISPRRYFCVQCHVPQTDAKPLVGNTFKKADGLR